MMPRIKPRLIRGYGRLDFDSFQQGKIGFKVELSWSYKNGFDPDLKHDSGCYIRLQAGNAPNNLPCDNVRAWLLSQMPPDQRWEKAHSRNTN
jgi:hypothetical protein